jgi:cytochrome c-type biogenesis protein
VIENVTLLAAFGAGLLSFISPCVLPLIPGYLSYISGLSLDEMRGTGTAAVAVPVRSRVIVSSLAFILGFSLVFVALGASASALGQFLMSRLTILGRIAGAIIVLFGLHTMGLLRIDWLYQEKRVQTNRRPAGFLGATLVGIAFAFGWTPCIGPILAGILAVAALAINRFFAAFARIRRHYHAIELASGALLVIIGILIFTNRFTVIARTLQPYLPVY